MESGSGQGPPFPPQGSAEAPVPTFLMFLLQNNLDCRAACLLRSEVAREEAQGGAGASGAWGAQVSLSPTVP